MLDDLKKENEFLLLQLTQLQEELEYYFLEYQKLSNAQNLSFRLGSIEQVFEKYLPEITQRYPQHLNSKGLVIADSFEQKEHSRLNVRLNSVQHDGQVWDGFNIIFNLRNDINDIEFHEAANDRVFPLSVFIETGRNEITAYSVMSADTQQGIDYIRVLPQKDRYLLQGILEEILFKLNYQQYQETESVKDLQIDNWIKRISSIWRFVVSQPPENMDLTENLVSLERQLEFENFRLIENYVGPANEHLYIQFKNLSFGKKHYPLFEFKLGAKEISAEGITEYGSLEFRELPGGLAPLVMWPPAESDEWGLKCVFDFPEKMSSEQKQLFANLPKEDIEFIRALLAYLSANLEAMQLGEIKMNKELSFWESLSKNLLEKA